MSSTTAPKEFTKANNSKLDDLINTTISSLSKTICSYAIFNIVFINLCIIEVVLFLLFFNLLAKSSLIAMTIAIFFVTIFSYMVLRVYLKSKKPDQIFSCCDNFIELAKGQIKYLDHSFQHHISLSSILCKVTLKLHDLEYSYYKPKEWISALAPSLEKFSCWLHFRDIHMFKEMILKAAIEEQIKLIKLEPTNLQLHAALANTYVMLSSIYANPLKGEIDEDHWIYPDRFSDEMQYKFRKVANKAIEEFKILNDYAPDDPWVHAQLAYSYRDMQMPQEEIYEYEIILKLRPDDEDTLFKLGELYFQQGQNSKGLQIYEKLKSLYPTKANALIKFYGSHSLDEDWED